METEIENVIRSTDDARQALRDAMEKIHTLKLAYYDYKGSEDSRLKKIVLDDMLKRLSQDFFLITSMRENFIESKGGIQ